MNAHKDIEHELDRMLESVRVSASADFTARTLERIRASAPVTADDRLDALLDARLTARRVTADDGFAEDVLERARAHRRSERTVILFPAWAKPLAWAASLTIAAFFGLKQSGHDIAPATDMAAIRSEAAPIDTEMAQILILASGLDDKTSRLLDDDYLDAIAALTY